MSVGSAELDVSTALSGELKSKLAQLTSSPNVLATMLYGSYARGTADANSDIDVLQLVRRAPRSFSRAQINVTQYLPVHIRRMAASGSLFVLHLLREGSVLCDEKGLLCEALAEYRAPTSYASLRAELLAAAASLDTSAEDFERYVLALARLGVYLVRTSAYMLCAEQGRAAFDAGAIASALCDPTLPPLLAMRRFPTRDFTRAHVKVLRAGLERLLGARVENPFGSVQRLSMHLEGHPYAEALLIQVISGFPAIDYAAIALPPL